MTVQGFLNKTEQVKFISVAVSSVKTLGVIWKAKDDVFMSVMFKHGIPTYRQQPINEQNSYPTTQEIWPTGANWDDKLSSQR